MKAIGSGVTGADHGAESRPGGLAWGRHARKRERGALKVVKKNSYWLGSFKRSGCPTAANLSLRHQFDIPFGTYFSPDRPIFPLYIDYVD
ncbi:hypothetical protein D3C80_1477160 [compost metagenome]